MRRAAVAALVVFASAVAPPAAGPGGAGEGGAVTIPLAPAAWEAVPADGVAVELAAVAGPAGRPALGLDFDFGGRGGWAAVRHPLDLELPASWEIRFTLQGAGTANHLELKLVDPSGDNVWWHVERDLAWPAEWTAVRVPQRRVTFAWGPAGGGEPGRLGALEIAVTAGGGGSGSIAVADLAIVPVEPLRPPAGPPRATATGERDGHPAAAALDGDRATTWRPVAGAGAAALTVDLRGRVELGGLSLFWEAGREPERFRVELSTDGETWETVREVASGGAPESHLRLPEAEASHLRVRLEPGACAAGCGLAELVVRPLAFGASPNAFFTALADEAPRGAYPRGFSGEAVYWTVVGLPGEPEEALFSEDGALEVGEKGFSLEPFLFLEREGEGRLWSWADVEPEQSLDEGDLPLPTVTWRLPGVRLEIAALPVLAPRHTAVQRATLTARYRVVNEGTDALRGRLLVAARPFQVNPPYQFLNVTGGVAPIGSVGCLADGLRVDGERLWTGRPADGCGGIAFDRGRLTDALAEGELPAAGEVTDPVEAASAALAWELDLAPGGRSEVVVAVPLSADSAEHAAALAAAGPQGFALVDARRFWQATLGPVELDLPAEAAPLVRTLRSSLAWILIHQDGPAIQPGSRAYARSWIRDGALTGAALLRLGHFSTAQRFAEWFAGFQYPDGKVPCCVDRRGADPVPEHDSHGELVHLIAEVHRFTGDRTFAERMFPHVVAAIDHIEALRQERRTAEYREGERRAFFGLLPESISHEGYAAKPVHSYWDDTFAYRGLDDAVGLARALDREEFAAEWARRRDEFRTDFLASIERVRQRDGLDYVPASADLGDFDPTSTTVALDPGGLGPHLPAAALAATFERFWRQIEERRSGSSDWDAYTPYEIRHVGAFVRLGWKERAHQLLDLYLADRRPLAWNGWPEVVTRDPREPRFLGDLPHGWVASDFIRSLLDLFAYEDREDGALVLAAGVPESWLARPEGIGVDHLGTPWGTLSYRLERRGGEEGGGVRYRLGTWTRSEEAGYRFSRPLEQPPGGFVFGWPLAGRPGRALVDGAPIELGEDGRVVVHGLPVTVELLTAAEETSE